MKNDHILSFLAVSLVSATASAVPSYIVQNQQVTLDCKVRRIDSRAYEVDGVASFGQLANVSWQALFSFENQANASCDTLKATAAASLPGGGGPLLDVFVKNRSANLHNEGLIGIVPHIEPGTEPVDAVLVNGDLGQVVLTAYPFTNGKPKHPQLGKILCQAENISTDPNFVETVATGQVRYWTTADTSSEVQHAIFTSGDVNDFLGAQTICTSIKKIWQEAFKTKQPLTLILDRNDQFNLKFMGFLNPPKKNLKKAGFYIN